MTHTCPKCGQVFEDAIGAAVASMDAPVAAVEAPLVLAPQEQENTGKPTVIGENPT